MKFIQERLGLKICPPLATYLKTNIHTCINVFELRNIQQRV